VGADSVTGALTTTIKQEVDIVEPGDFYAFPGVAVNENGQTAIVFQASGATQPLSTWWTMKDAAETSFGPPTT
jgi:hypothetical protein